MPYNNRPSAREEAAQLQTKYERLVDGLTAVGELFLAFSGGVDSALLAAAARTAPGVEMTAVYFLTPLAPAGEREQVEALAAQMGITLLIEALDPRELPEVYHNRRQRCYYCKRLMLTRLRRLAGQAVLCDGSNADDAGENRPGAQALRELGVRSPLAEAGLTKAEIRALARTLNVPVWDKPSTPCLATRFPYDCELTTERLERVRCGEEILQAAGFFPCRLRVQGDLARVQLPRHLQAALADKTPPELMTLGFKYVTLDLEPLVSGDFDKKEQAEKNE